jgi:DNA polymerase Ligase (LigD)
LPRFVLLEHTWGGVHWDLMLEVADALRTWAIDAPMVPGVDLPARLLGDHRLAYLDYEGPVSGNRGSVRRVESGVYETRLWMPDVVRIELRGAQLVGELELRSVGRAGGGPPAWVCRLGKAD